MDTVHKLFLGERLALEKFFHKVVVGFGYGFRERRNKTVHAVLHFLGYLRRRHFRLDSVALGVVSIGFHFDKVYKGNYFSVLDNGYYNRADRGAELCFEVCENVVEISVRVVYLCDNEHFGLAQLAGEVISLFRTYLYARFCGNGYHYRTRGGYTLVHTSGEVKQTGSVKKIYFYIAADK